MLEPLTEKAAVIIHIGPKISIELQDAWLVYAPCFALVVFSVSCVVTAITVRKILAAKG